MKFKSHFTFEIYSLFSKIKIETIAVKVEEVCRSDLQKVKYTLSHPIRFCMIIFRFVDHNDNQISFLRGMHLSDVINQNCSSC